MHTDAYRCIQMRADAYRRVQTCTPQDLPRYLSFSSSSALISPVSSALRIRLSQNYYPPAAVYNYACRCMPPHTMRTDAYKRAHLGILLFSFPSNLILSLLLFLLLRGCV
jgi:hypothetical protein